MRENDLLARLFVVQLIGTMASVGDRDDHVKTAYAFSVPRPE